MGRPGPLYVIVLAMAVVFVFAAMVIGRVDPNLAAILSVALFTGGVVVRVVI